MSLQNDTDPTASNSGYGSSDETASLLMMSSSMNQSVGSNSSTTTTTGSSIISTISKSRMNSFNGPTNSAAGQVANLVPSGSGNSNPMAMSANISSSNNKPILIRQDRTSTYLASPQLSATGLGGSEESAAGGEDHQDQHNARSVPDIEMHCRLEAPSIAVSNSCHSDGGGVGGAGRVATGAGSAASSNYQLVPYNRCRACRNCDRRASTTPVSTLQLTRSVSKESVRSALHSRLQQVQHSTIPPVLITSSPTSGSRIIRQSSQPEASSLHICCGSQCAHACGANPSSSLRQLREPGDGIAGIAADSLRINGGMRQFKQ
ncbi:hypothetical protein pipiens_016217, partial [Culex pipiens pipiens]